MAQAQQPFSCVTFATSGDALVTDASSMALMLSSSHLCQILQPGAIQMIHQQLREPEKSAGLEAFALLCGSAGRAAYEQRHQACMPAYVLSVAQCQGGVGARMQIVALVVSLLMDLSSDSGN